MLKKLLYTCMVCLGVAAGSSAAKAEEVTFAIGEWAPHISESLPGYGPHAQKATEILEKAGYTVKYEFMPWSRAYNLVKSGRMPVSFSWFKTEERLQEVLFPTTPIFSSRSVAYYNKSKHPGGITASTLKDLVDQGLKIASVQSFWYEKELKELGADTHQVNKDELAWRLLDAGRVDVYVAGTDVAETAVTTLFGADGMAKFGMTDTIKADEMFPIFTSATPQGRKLMEAWDANAK